MENYKEQLKKIYPCRIELHAHTKPVSGCSEIPPEEMARIYHEKRYDAVVITNHFLPGKLSEMSADEAVDWYMSGYEQTKAAGEKLGLKVLLGAELRFSESINDYLLFGVNREILLQCHPYLKKDLPSFRREVHLPDSVFVQAHPFRDNMERCDPTLLDGIEVLNMHPNHASRNGIAIRYAAENNFKIRTVGSDFHHLNRGHEAVSALRTKTVPEDSFALAAILRSGDYIFELGENVLVLP